MARKCKRTMTLADMDMAVTAMIVRLALKHTGGNRRATAKALNISERTLYRKLRAMRK